jgi:hypothetical protein
MNTGEFAWGFVKFLTWSLLFGLFTATLIVGFFKLALPQLSRLRRPWLAWLLGLGVLAAAIITTAIGLRHVLF